MGDLGGLTSQFTSPSFRRDVKLGVPCLDAACTVGLNLLSLLSGKHYYFQANILNDFFVQQCSEISTGSTIPNFLPPCNSSFTDVAINRDKVLRLIRALDSKKAGGCDNISVHMIKIRDASIVESLVACLLSSCYATCNYA